MTIWGAKLLQESTRNKISQFIKAKGRATVSEMSGAFSPFRRPISGNEPISQAIILIYHFIFWAFLGLPTMEPVSKMVRPPRKGTQSPEKATHISHLQPCGVPLSNRKSGTCSAKKKSPASRGDTMVTLLGFKERLGNHF